MQEQSSTTLPYDYCDDNFSVPKLRELPQEAISEIADVLEEVYKNKHLD